MESVLQDQMRLDDVTLSGWGAASNHLRKRDMEYGPTELKVPAVGRPNHT
jgi:hypothetical protein